MQNFDDTKNKILQSAILLFATKGIDSVGVRAICSHADVASSAVSYHFGCKENLIQQCIKHCFKLINERISEIDATFNGTAAGFAVKFATTLEEFDNEIRLLFTYFSNGKLSDIEEASSTRVLFIKAMEARSFNRDKVAIRAEAFFYAAFNDQLSRIFNLNQTSAQRMEWLQELATTLFNED